MKQFMVIAFPHNNLVNRSFGPGEIDSWKRGSLMLLNLNLRML